MPRKRPLMGLALLASAAGQATQEGLEEVIVTAQKRTEPVLDVPISISVFNARTIEDLSARNLTDLGRFTAGVEMINIESLQPTYTIRGVETNDWTVGSGPAVALYIDGVYAARGAGADAALVDVQRIEILKGPQGTLFGRNATGGAIHILTSRPGLRQEGRLKLTAGNYDRLDGELIYNQPIGDGLAFRVVAMSRRRDGYLENLSGTDLNDEDRRAARLGVLWQANDRTELLWRAEYSELDQHSAAVHTVIRPVFELANAGRRYRPFRDVSTDLINREKRELFSTSLEITHHRDDVTFTSITGWREFRTELVEDSDGAENPDYVFHPVIPEDSDYFSQEFRFSGATEVLKWAAGTVYSREHVDQTVTAAHESWIEEVRSRRRYQSWALYGDATWSVTDRFNLTGGLRYTYDDREFDLYTRYRNQIAGVDFGMAFYNNGEPPLDATQSEDSDNLSGRLVLDYTLGEDSMLFASVATGFKSGGFNSLNFGPEIDTSYDEEEVINYEFGLKGQYLERRLNLNVSAFFYEYDNLQELKLLGQPIPSYNLRKSDAEGYGLELEAAWRAASNLTLSGNYSYLKTEYTNFRILGAVGESGEDDLSGQPRIGTPEHKLNLSFEYVLSLGNFGRLVPRVDYSWSDERVGSLDDPAREVDAFSLTNARITLLPDRGVWELAAWVTNALDEEVHIEFSSNGDTVGSLAAGRVPPRMFGADFIYHF